MPFTLAHPAAIVPLYKKFGQYFVFSALIIGSVSPDMFYFLPLGIDRWYSHTFLGIFYLDLPIGILLYYLFHWLLSPVFYALLSLPLQRRVSPYLARGTLPKKSLGLIVLSLFVGALTHVVWDSFTHYSGLPVQYFKSMQQILFQIDSYNVYLFRLLQHVSTLIGLILLWIWLRQWYKTTALNARTTFIFSRHLVILSKTSLIFLPLFIGLYSGYLNKPDFSWMYNLQVFIRYTIFTGGSVFLLVWCILGIVYKYHLMRHYKKS